MDLVFKNEKGIVNIRAAGIIKTPAGFLLQVIKSGEGYKCLPGGRIKFEETSEQAFRRELKEELDWSPSKVFLRAVFESFFYDGANFHEILFLYEVEDVYTLTFSKHFTVIPPEKLNDFDIRPKIAVELMTSPDKTTKHFTLKLK